MKKLTVLIAMLMASSALAAEISDF